MTFVLILLGAIAALELGMYTLPWLWQTRRVWCVVVLLGTAFGGGALVALHLTVFTALFALLSLYRIFNMIRIAEHRMHEAYLKRATRRTGVVLLLAQAVVALLGVAWEQWGSTGHLIWASIAGVQCVAAAILLWSVLRNGRRMHWPTREHNYSDSQLPAVTVAIPARNETDDLQQCLQDIIASDYPKLEIIVLDDCSQVRRTPEIIRAFAHDGVRFIQGREPGEGWLPKNQAYQRLAQSSSGQILLFCGVDIRFEPGTIREIISVMLDRNKEMLSVLPRRQRAAYGHLSLVQAMRYYWELVPPRRLFNRPPVLSSCWAIRSKALQRAGGFAAVARAIVPEAYFARELTKTDGYSFLMATEAVGLSSTKQIREQRETAVRTRYPQVHRRPEQVVLLGGAEAGILLLPFVIAVLGFWVSIGPVAQVLATLASGLLTVVYAVVTLRTHVNTWWFTPIGQPLMILVDLCLLHYSMYKYEFSTVDWKGRNVCVPAMYVTPHLPRID